VVTQKDTCDIKGGHEGELDGKLLLVCVHWLWEMEHRTYEK